MGRSPEVPVGFSQASFPAINLFLSSPEKIARLAGVANGEILEIVSLNTTVSLAHRRNGDLSLPSGFASSVHTSWREDFKYKLTHSWAELMLVDFISCSPLFFPPKNKGIEAVNLIADHYQIPIVMHRLHDAPRYNNNRSVGLEIYGVETPETPEDLGRKVHDGVISGVIPDFSERRWLQYCKNQGVGNNDAGMLKLLERMLDNVILAHVQIGTPDELSIALNKDYNSRLARLINKAKQAPNIRGIILELNYGNIRKMTGGGDTLRDIYPQIVEFVQRT